MCLIRLANFAKNKQSHAGIQHITHLPAQQSAHTYRINVYVIVVLLVIHGFEETLDLSVCTTVYRQNERYSDVVCDVRR